MNEPAKQDAEHLCKTCGLCCQGIFHPYANIYGTEDLDIANRIEAKIVETPGETPPRSFSLPCPAFKGSCSVYPDRPSVCKAHQCDLLASLVTGDTSLEGALTQVDSIKEQLEVILPKLHELSGDKSSNQPEKLLGTVLDNLASTQNRNAFKKEQAELLMRFGVFKRISGSTFYRDDPPTEPD